MSIREDLSEQMSKVLAEQRGWCREYADGFVAGEASREKDETIPRHAMVGIDDWALGFRTGYFRLVGSTLSQVQTNVISISDTAQKNRRAKTA